ncbi:glycosyltransferase family 4 protein [Roseivirga sp. E12]|uniref:glycosyltransferase family 4 protein n=1 Tax=Roseivirga sp. E12 TaxID=2819237 RepID=UPI001ABC2EA1|nr:glycosyltransferase family 4 protein [Roseivirga sp. E12]MBO3699075.1 glycosyltransferase family 4 protein [Roseivirga sp. E12]
MKRALIITSEFPPGPGGIGQHAASLALTLANDYSVDVLCNQDYASKDEIDRFQRSTPENIVIISFVSRNKPFAPFRRVLQARQMTKKRSYDLIIVSGLLPLWIGAVLKHTTKSTIHGFIHGNEVNLKKTIKSWVTKWSYQSLDYLYPVSSFTKSLLSPRLNQETRVIPNGLDQALLLNAEDFLEKEQRIKLEGEPAFLTVGNVTLRKGQQRVIRALPKVLEKYPNAHYHVVGLPTKEEELKTLATDLGVMRSVTFHGRLPTRNELYQMYRSADLFIMLSENQSNGDVEGFGIAILEANAFGLPAIGALGCGIEDAISKENGILVDGNDTVEILEAIKTLLLNKEEYSRGSKVWANRHDWRKLVQKIVR